MLLVPPELVAPASNRLRQVRGRVSCLLQERDIRLPPPRHLDQHVPRRPFLEDVPAHDPDHSAMPLRAVGGAQYAPARAERTMQCAHARCTVFQDRADAPRGGARNCSASAGRLAPQNPQNPASGPACSPKYPRRGAFRVFRPAPFRRILRCLRARRAMASGNPAPGHRPGGRRRDPRHVRAQAGTKAAAGRP